MKLTSADKEALRAAVFGRSPAKLENLTQEKFLKMGYLKMNIYGELFVTQRARNKVESLRKIENIPLTARMLRIMGACKEEVARFEKAHPEGLYWTPKDIRKVDDDWADWFTDFLSEEDYNVIENWSYEEYKKKTAIDILLYIYQKRYR